MGHNQNKFRQTVLKCVVGLGAGLIWGMDAYASAPPAPDLQFNQSSFSLEWDRYAQTYSYSIKVSENGGVESHLDSIYSYQLAPNAALSHIVSSNVGSYIYRVYGQNPVANGTGDSDYLSLQIKPDGTVLTSDSTVVNFDDYDLYLSGNGEVYFHGRDIFVPIAADIVIPLIFDGPIGFKYESGFTQVIPFDLNNDSLGGYSKAIEGEDFYKGDLNNDGRQDILVYNQSGDGSGVIFYGSSNPGLPSISTFSYQDAPSFSHFSSSSQISAAQSDIKVITAEESGIDVVFPARPGSNGVSVNRFSSFNVQDRPVQIANVSSYEQGANGDEVRTDMAGTIVIIADEFNLNGEISIAGPATDVVFISTKAGGTINCNNCVIKNALRVSFVTAAPEIALTPNTSTLGLLHTTENSQINITDLYAPGAIALDVVTDKLNFTGVIDSHQRGIKDSRGGYTNLETGDKLIGSGGVNIVLGRNGWDYEQQTLIGTSYSGSYSFTGDVRSSRVALSVAGDLNFNGYADTRTDVLSAVAYKNGTIIAEEGIQIQTFSGGDLDVNSDVISGGTINLNSANDLRINSTVSSLNGKIVNLIGIGNVYNYGTLTGGLLTGSANEFVNEGNLLGSAGVSVWAQNDVVNQYGGRIVAENVTLHSETRIVRNGSRTPYRSRGIETQDFLSFDIAKFEDDYADRTKMGTFYNVTSGVNTSDNSLVKPTSNLAYIIADNIEIGGQAFENINPYYEKVTDDEEVELDRSLVSQVYVSAENSLKIITEKYVVNSSAYLSLNNVDGLADVQTDLFVNDRYRVVTILVIIDESFSNDLIINGQQTGLTMSGVNEGAKSQTVAYAPPGLVLSLGKMDVIASDAFINNTAYVEVFSDMDIDTEKVIEFGVENEEFVRSSSTVYLSNTFSAGIWSSFTAADGKFKADPQQLDSLFFVKGHLYAPDGKTFFETKNIFDYFVRQAVQDEMNTHLLAARTTEGYHSSLSGAYGYAETTTIENSRVSIGTINKEDDEIKVRVSQDYVRRVTSENSRTTAYDTHLEVGDIAGQQTTTVTHTYSIFEELVELYESLKTSILAFFDELDWWN